MAAKTQDAKFREKLKQYGEKYDLSSLTNPNDEDNLYTMIRNQIVIDDLQIQMYNLVANTEEENIVKIQKYNNTIAQLSATNMAIEKTLAIDRKSRKAENEQSVAEYWARLKQLALEFLDEEDRLVKVMCKHCKIMIGRISGVYDTTHYICKFQCPQCKDYMNVERKEKDIFFDLKPADRDWRRKYPIEIVHPEIRNDELDNSYVEDDVVLNFDNEDTSGEINSEGQPTMKLNPPE